ncbi:MAG: LPS export ABC transporter periplasmic protein LptC [Lewinellaceae bacterium]|nr:LPS export ABC transporter periplasmic protein LptC [Lewinellaceae bacterium]
MPLFRLLFPFLFGMLLLAACDRASQRAELPYTDEDTKVEAGKDVEILYSDSAIVRIRITAPTMLNYTDRENPRQVFPDKVKVEFLNGELKVTSTLTAQSAVREQEKGIITMRTDVVLKTADNDKLETEELIWDERSGLVHTDKFVKVTKPGEILYGFGLEANQDFSYWKILVPKGRVKTNQIDEAIE